MFVEFSALGALEVRINGTTCQLGGPRQRAVLAALLVRANAFSTVEYLVEAVWETPPATPESNLRSYVTGLRRQLGAEAGRLVTRPGGYLLRVDTDEFDLATFDTLAARGRAADDPRSTVALLEAALELWRGRPFEGLTVGPALAMEAAAIDDRYHGLVADYVAARFELGEYAEVVPQLRRLTTIHPLREQLWVDLVTALHKSGRRADALAAYRDVRTLLDRELGIRPSAPLQQVHADVLAGSQPLQPDEPRTPARQLPPEVDHFTGRQGELRDILDLLGSPRERLPIVTVSGPPGVGKSALAVSAAHRLCASYPDGQLFVDLTGAAAKPREPGDVLARFLRDLGVPDGYIPATTEERASLFRDRIADKRMLVVLDNAAADAQVRPLLPGSRHCGVVVTSRRRLTGLDVSLRVQLDKLGPADAVDLLGQLAGSVETPVATRIVRSCGHLPLAIRIIGTKLRTHAHLRATVIATRLEDERHRLDELVSGDREVRAGFLVSYKQLGAQQRRAFRLLALVPGRDITGWVAAAALNVEEGVAERLMEDLVEANLLECASPDLPRLRFHDLIRLLAEERVAAETDATEQDVTLTRILAAHLQLAQRADQALPFGGMHRFELPASGTSALAGRISRNAPQWFDEETPRLLAALEVAAKQGKHLMTCQLAATLAAYLESRGRWDELARVAELGLGAARELNNDYWITWACFASGLAARERRDVVAAQRYFALCLAALPGLDNPRLEVMTLLAAGVGERFLGRYDHAEENFLGCLSRLATMDEPNWVACAQRELGLLYRYRGDWDRASRHLQDAADEFVLLGDRSSEAVCLRELGIVQRETEDHVAARRLLRTAQQTFHALGDDRREAASWRSLSRTYLAMGDLPAAESCCDRGTTILSRTHDVHGSTRTSVLHAEIAAAQGRPIAATTHLRTALATFRELGDPRWIGKTQLRLSAVLAAQGRTEEAEKARQAAEEQLNRIGAYERAHRLPVTSPRPAS
jgi:DNA-binding SARP family transcriptional activator/tetratricopeptide (TPR) repeat protein